jgi:hypothetical protein
MLGMTSILETGSHSHMRTTELFIYLPDFFPPSFRYIINSRPLGYLLVFIDLCRHLVTGVYRTHIVSRGRILHFTPSYSFVGS